MKYLNAELTADVVASYDKTKTTRIGRAFESTIIDDVIAPPLTKVIDFFTDTGGLSPYGVSDFTTNNRIFALSTITTGLASLCYWTYTAPNTYTYGGRVILPFPNVATTTTLVKFFRVLDSDVNNIKVLAGTTGSVVINGGVLLYNKIALSDFTTGPSPITIQFAVQDDIRGAYKLVDPAGIGTANNITVLMGGGYNSAGNEIIITNGTAASFNTQGFTTNVAPTLAVAQAVTPPNSGSAVWAAAGHTFAVNDPVCFSTTGTAPGGFTASNSVTHQVYFVRNPVAGVSYELSATSGGASITSSANPTGTATAFHAFGQSSNNFIAARKSGTIVSGFAGTALLLDNQKIDTQAESTSPNFNQLVYFFPTTTSFYNFRISDISAGVTTLPTAQLINNTGTGVDFLAPTNVVASYDSTINRIVYASAAFSWLAKRWVNSQITNQFGGQANDWLENTGDAANYFRLNAISGCSLKNGKLVVTGASATAGQRVLLVSDLYSDTSLDSTYVISKVLDTKSVPGSVFKFISTIENLYEITDTITVSYRTAATSSDAVFNSATGGWTVIDTNADLSAISLLRYVQFKISFDVMTILSGIPTQVNDIVFGFVPNNELSEHWTGSYDNSSRDGETPTKSAFRLAIAYTSSVPTLYFRAYDDSGNIVVSANTSANPSLFEYSTNNGTSWNALGTIPNTVGTTEVRYNWASPPGVRVTVSLRED